MNNRTSLRLLRIYERLNNHFGDLRWWPGESPFEVMIGAILAQNTAWLNVEKAICNLKGRDLLTPAAMLRVDEEVLAGLIRPSGYFRIKAKRIKSFMNWILLDYGGHLERMFLQGTDQLREKLLAVNGIGEETADSILLYACERPVFVVDAYTRRILERHGILKSPAKYGEVQKIFMDNLPRDLRLYNQFHALIVNTGKSFCRSRPVCGDCPLNDMRPTTAASY